MRFDPKALALTGKALRTTTPAEIDQRIYLAYREIGYAQVKLDATTRRIDLSLRHRDSGGFWMETDQQALERDEAEKARLSAWLKELRGFVAPLEAEYERRGGWSRAWLCVTRGRGHVHRSRACSQLYATSRTELVWELSGTTETEIVEAAGERACTTCYPSAPVDLLKRPTRVFSEEERERAAARKEREAKRAAREANKAAQAITTPDGTPLRNHRGDIIKTERAAMLEYVDVQAELDGLTDENARYCPEWRVKEMEQAVARIAAALAHKRGGTVEEFIAEAAPKVAAKVRKNRRIAEASRRRNPGL